MPFQPGASGNPKGRRVELEMAEVRILARQHTQEAVERLYFWSMSDDPRASVAASIALLDRGWGRPSQSVELNGEVEIRDKRREIEAMVEALEQPGAVQRSPTGALVFNVPALVSEARTARGDGAGPPVLDTGTSP